MRSMGCPEWMDILFANNSHSLFKEISWLNWIKYVLNEYNKIAAYKKISALFKN